MTCGNDNIPGRRLLPRANATDNGKMPIWDSATNRFILVDVPTAGDSSDSDEKFAVVILPVAEKIITLDDDNVMFVNDTALNTIPVHIPAHSTTAFPIGFRFFITKTQAGSQLNLSFASGVTINGYSTGVSQNSKGEVVNIGVNKWTYTETEYKPAVGMHSLNFTVTRSLYGVTELYSSVARTITIPNDTTAPTIPNGFSRDFVQTEVGKWTFTPQVGITLFGRTETTNVGSTYRLIKLAPNVWFIAENVNTAWVDELISAGLVGIFKDQGGYAVSNNNYPTSANTIGGVAVKKGFLWTANGTATYNGLVVTNGDVIRALVDAPGQTHANWAIMEGNFGYTPENVTNKATNLAAPDHTKYTTSQTVVDGIAASKLLIATAPVASHPLVLSDAGKTVRMDVATANDVTVPANATVAFDIGTQIVIFQKGAGQTSVLPAVGVTINAIGLKLFAQYTAATLIKVGTNEWDLIGNLTT